MKVQKPHCVRSRVDPFEHTWPTAEQWLRTNRCDAKELMDRLARCSRCLRDQGAAAHAPAACESVRSERAKETDLCVLKQAESQTDLQSAPRRFNDRHTDGIEHGINALAHHSECCDSSLVIAKHHSANCGV